MREFFYAKTKNPFALRHEVGRDKPLFFNILESGKINLFESSSISATAGVHIGGMAGSGTFGDGRSSDITYYAEKVGSDSLHLLKNNSILKSNTKNKLLFEALISDDKELLDFYKQKDEFSFDVIRSTIKTYNRRNKKQN